MKLAFVLYSFLALTAAAAPDAEHVSDLPRPNFSEAVVNAYLSSPDSCHLYARESNSVQAGAVVVGPRVRIARDSADLLAQCEQIKRDAGIGGCASIELAGHAH